MVQYKRKRPRRARKKGENMAEKIFPAALDRLDEVLAFTEEELEKLDCPMKATMQINVCVEEMFVNVAHYAYEGKEGTATLAVEPYADGGVSITLTDAGIPFDPLAKTDPDITLSADERAIGGLGIYMVKKSMDEVSYERRDDKNVFTMIKKF